MGLPNTVESIALLASPSSYSPRFWSLPSCVVQQVLLATYVTIYISLPKSNTLHQRPHILNRNASPSLLDLRLPG